MQLLTLPKIYTKEIGLSIFGCALIILGASFKIPFCPVPFTLQTLALYIVALTQTPQQAFYSTASYLTPVAYKGYSFAHINAYVVTLPYCSFCHVRKGGQPMADYRTEKLHIANTECLGEAVLCTRARVMCDLSKRESVS